ncbi:MAG: N-acetyl-D-Glu racemase DgcA [Pseudomonadota bacterium]
MRQTKIATKSSPLNAAFAISRGAKSSAETVLVEIQADGKVGRGECVPYARYGESCDSVVAQLETIVGPLDAGLSRQDLQSALPAGAARCAADCALWDLEAKQSGRPVWQSAKLSAPRPLPTTMTLSLAAADDMAAAARATPATLLKLKLGGPGDLVRVKAVHEARPDAKLVLDGNEGLEPDTFPELVSAAQALGVIMIEQPFPVGQDEALLERPAGVSICADESVHTCTDLETLAAKYDAVNLKLDKAGGLTEGLRMLTEAKRLGMGTMVGCMVAGSISMAPALLLGQDADMIDLDGPLWLRQDVPHGLIYSGGHVSPPSRALWG